MCADPRHQSPCELNLRLVRWNEADSDEPGGFVAVLYGRGRKEIDLNRATGAGVAELLQLLERFTGIRFPAVKRAATVETLLIEFVGEVVTRSQESFVDLCDSLESFLRRPPVVGDLTALNRRHVAGHGMTSLLIAAFDLLQRAAVESGAISGEA